MHVVFAADFTCYLPHIDGLIYRPCFWLHGVYLERQLAVADLIEQYGCHAGLTLGPLAEPWTHDSYGARHLAVLDYILLSNELESRAALIMLAAPTAVMSYVLTDQLGGDSDLSASSIAVSTVLSLITFATAIACPL